MPLRRPVVPPLGLILPPGDPSSPPRPELPDPPEPDPRPELDPPPLTSRPCGVSSSLPGPSMLT
ncbi:hypothetical protein D5I55_04640 [Chakrabartia godavariana]|nr:hypothetical protein D5I55_04640 [Chakrabartia godavariana]